MSPEPLRAGARVAVISPAGPVLPENIELGLKTLSAWGLEVDLLEPFLRDRGYLAGADSARLSVVQQALDGGYSAIIATRGGYGTTRILDQLNFTGFSEKPSILCGFSDITALHLHIAGNLGIPTLHGPVLKSFGAQSGDLPALKRALFGERLESELAWKVRTVKGNDERIEGRLLGGNLTLITALLDSNFVPDLDGVILFVEDVGEADYRIDRLLTSLRLSRRAKGLRALILGDFTDCEGVYADRSSIQRLIEACASDFPCPIVADFPVGHGSRNAPIPLGVQATLDLSTGTLQASSDVTSGGLAATRSRRDRIS